MEYSQGASQCGAYEPKKIRPERKWKMKRAPLPAATASASVRQLVTRTRPAAATAMKASG